MIIITYHHIPSCSEAVPMFPAFGSGGGFKRILTASAASAFPRLEET